MKTINWCGYNWSAEMEGGRIIHPGFPHLWYSSDENVLKINENNELELTFRENPKKITYWDGTVYNPKFETGLLRSKESFGFGNFSAEICLPQGVNLWPSFWISGDGNWPPEIDIMEAWSDDSNYFHWFTPQFPWFNPSWDTTTNVHYNDENLQHKHLGSKPISFFKQPLNPSKNWIKYECEWRPDKIVFKANGKTVQIVKSKYANMLINNLNNPENGYLMNVIFNVYIDNPNLNESKIETPFKIRNFNYEPLV